MDGRIFGECLFPITKITFSFLRQSQLKVIVVFFALLKSSWFLLLNVWLKFAYVGVGEEAIS